MNKDTAGARVRQPKGGDGGEDGIVSAIQGVGGNVCGEKGLSIRISEFHLWRIGLY